MPKLKKLLSLFLTFLKIGAFTFGGGYAMIPIIKKELVENKKWISENDILDIIAIAESTPGPIAINAATFIGVKVGGFFGAFLATLGVVLPSFLIISMISLILERFQEIRAVRYAFFGIRAGVLALLVNAFITMFKKLKKEWIPLVIASLAFLISVFVDVNVIFIIIGSGLLGLLSFILVKRRVKK